MNYQIHITALAEHDLNEAVDYIEFVLKNPEAADHLLALISEKICSLASSPEKYPVADDHVLRSWGIRIIPINRYLAFYTVDDRAGMVYIIRFLYGKRDWSSILRRGLRD